MSIVTRRVRVSSECMYECTKAIVCSIRMHAYTCLLTRHRAQMRQLGAGEIERPNIFEHEVWRTKSSLVKQVLEWYGSILFASVRGLRPAARPSECVSSATTDSGECALC